MREWVSEWGKEEMREGRRGQARLDYEGISVCLRDLVLYHVLLCIFIYMHTYIHSMLFIHVRTICTYE